jgi:ATP synthase protein I
VNFRNKTPLHRLPVFRVLRAQALVTVLMAATCAGVFGVVAGYSALLGGLIALVANLYFAYKAFRFFGARSAQAIVQSFWSGEMGKLILTAALFALALFAGYVLALGTGASALLLMKSNPKH